MNALTGIYSHQSWLLIEKPIKNGYWHHIISEETLVRDPSAVIVGEQMKSDFKEIIENSANVRGTQAKITMIQTNLASNKKFLKFMEGRDSKLIP